MNRRLIVLILILVLIVAGIGAGLVWAVNQQNQTNAPTVKAPQLQRIGKDQALSPIPATNNQGIWYFNPDGRLFRMNIDGSGLTEYPLPALSGTIRKAIWPSSGEDFIAITSGSAGETKDYYNSKQKIYVHLPTNIKSLDWMPDSQRVIYIWQSADNQHQQLIQANADGTGFTKITEVLWPDLQVKISPDSKTVLLIRGKPEGNLNKIYAIDLATKQFRTIIDQGKNLDAMWISPNRFLFTQAAITANPKVYLYDLAAKKATDLEIVTTMDKITASKDGSAVYAAIPRKDGSGDDFITEDLVNFRKSDYFVSDKKIFAQNLMLIGQDLYFVNTADLGIYGILK